MGRDKIKRDTRIQDYDSYFNKLTKRRFSSALRSYQKYVSDSYIYMAGGLPNANLFPITQIQLRLRDGGTAKIGEDEMKIALQYGETKGFEPMRLWLVELQRRLHQPPTLPQTGVPPALHSDMDLIITNGSTDGLTRVIETIIEEGDSILMEEATYCSTFNVFKPLGAKAVSVKADSGGMKSCDLERVLSTWNEAVSGRRPQLVYCIPVGANPTGANWSLDRKKEIYAIARKYNLLILEDDPYYMVQFTKVLVPSMLSIDEDGRVLRCDSFSKLLSAGSRTGYLSGPKQFVERVACAMETGVGSANMLAQMIIWKVLQSMGMDGFIQHGVNTATFYRERCQLLIQFAEKHLKGLADWSPPGGGLFLWMKFLGVKDSNVICEKLIERGAVFVHGSLFYPVSTDSPYVRISYSYATQKEMDKSFQMLAEILREEAEK